jgi:hypothetical protein
MTNAEIESLVSEFTSKLTILVRRSALEQVLQSLGGDSPAKRGPGRPRGTTAGAAKPSGVAKIKKGGRRSGADLEGFSDQLLSHVKANPGQRGEQIAKALGTDVHTMRLPMKKLIAAKKIKTAGARRGMTYTAR